MRRALAVIAIAFLAREAEAAHKTENIIFVMTDGLRWQEVFRGSDPALTKVKAMSRSELMPFLWNTIARDGQIYGNRDKGSEAFVTNGLNFSYPGYNETLCGFVDPGIRSNDKIPNPNVTVLEWLNSKRGFQGKVAAFGAWDVFPFIFNAARAGFVVNAGYDPLEGLPGSPRIELLNQLKRDGPRVWPDEAFDSVPFYTALEYLKLKHPRVLYLSLGETDDWAHAGKHPEYLESAHRVDGYLKRLWETVQAIPQYRGKTSLIFSTDHGRGEGAEWTKHGEKVPEAKYIWMAFLGPDIAALGERSGIAPVTQNQIAATLAALLGEDYPASVPKSGAPIQSVFR